MRGIASKLKRKLKPDDLEERCGLVLKGKRVIETVNNHPHRTAAFLIPAREMRANEAELVGTWHTHPNQSAALSQDDYLGFQAWPDLTHYIVGTDGVRAYQVVNGVIEEVPCS